MKQVLLWLFWQLPPKAHTYARILSGGWRIVQYTLFKGGIPENGIDKQFFGLEKWIDNRRTHPERQILP